MNIQECYKLVEETLKCNGFSVLKDEDVKNLSIGIHLFTKLAFAAIEKPTIKASISSVSNCNELLSTKDKVSGFINKHFDSFWRICKTNFPFSKVENTDCEAALKIHLSYPSKPFLIRFLTLKSSSWMNELELDAYFTETFKYLTIQEIKEACLDFSFSYRQCDDSKAGFYFLWLIKQITESAFIIPEIEIFDNRTVKNVLSSLINNNGEDIKFSTRFIEILFFKNKKSESPLFQNILDEDYQNQFTDFTISQLQEIREDSWSEKRTVIVDLLKTINMEKIFIMAKALNSSTENEIDEIGHHLLKACECLSFKLAIPHLNALTELLPNLTHKNIQKIFNTPFKKFKYNKQCDAKTFNFIRRLKFSDPKKVFMHGNLMIGVYENKRAFCEEFPPHLLAYDINTEKMVWGIPLNTLKKKSANFKVNQIDDTISLQFEKDNKVFFIQSDMGEVISTLTTPLDHGSRYDALHITPNSLFGYQMVTIERQRILAGGKIIDSKWIPSFEVQAPPGLFIPMSTHVGFEHAYIGPHNDFKRTLTIFGPSGAKITIENCLSVEKITSGNKLYLLEKNPNEQNSCLLTMRTMTDDENVVSKVEKCIPINAKAPSLVKLCDNEEWILFSNYSTERSPIFVNMCTEEVVYSTHQVGFSETVVNTASGEIWNWNPQSKEIWKTSSKESVFIETLQSGSGSTTLLHVNEKDYLYYLDSRL